MQRPDCGGRGQKKGRVIERKSQQKRDKGIEGGGRKAQGGGNNHKK